MKMAVRGGSCKFFRGLLTGEVGAAYNGEKEGVVYEEIVDLLAGAAVDDLFCLY